MLLSEGSLDEQVLGILDPYTPLSPSEIAHSLDIPFQKKIENDGDEEGVSGRLLVGQVLNRLQKSGKITEKRGTFTLAEDNVVNIASKKGTVYDTFVGVVERDNSGQTFVKPALQEFNKMSLQECFVPEGAIVTVQYAVDDFNQVAKVIHNHGLLEQEAGLSKLMALAYGAPIEFPADIMEGSPELKIPALSKYRTDFRHIPFVTIDPVDAKDFDDAISVRKKGKNWEVMVAVADVSHYVRPGTKLFDEAYKRGNSIYLPDVVFPMLPEPLSNGVCSLKPDEDRACIVTTMIINPEGHVINHKQERGLMRSRARLTYEQVQNAIEGKPVSKEVQGVYNRYIKKAYDVYQVLLKDRVRRGTLDLDVMEQAIHVSKSGKLRIVAEGGNESHGVIEELMIAANRCAAETLHKRVQRAIYRVHGKPNEGAYNRSLAKFRHLGVQIPPEHYPIEQKLSHILKQADNSAHRDKIKSLVIKIQDRAHYDTQLSDHFGLQLKKYTHKTSPIRRMTDLMVDYLLNEIVGGGVRLPAEKKKKMSRMARHFSETERRAQTIEQEVNKRHIAQWIKENMDQSFQAKVCAVSARGVEIKIKDPEIVATMRFKDQWQYKAGDNIDVSPTHADPVTGIIQFKVLEQEALTYDSIGELSFMQAPQARKPSVV